VIPHDTSRAAHDAQIAAYRAMGPEARVAMAAEMSEDVRRIALDGIRARHPEYSVDDARRALLRLVLGDALVARAWPDEPFVAP
jgi:hypothetical protein